MSASPNQPDDTPTPPDKSTVLLLLGTLLDTTWRMFVPPLIGGLLGWWADSMWHTFPWLSLMGVVLGCVVTAIFIRNLLRKVKNAQ